MNRQAPQASDRWENVGYWLAWLALLASLFHPAANYGRAILNHRTLHNSDVAFISLFSRDVLARGSFDGWDLPTNPYFFPDMTFFILIDLVANNANLAVNLFAALQLLLTIVGLILLQRHLFGSARLPQTLTLLVFTLCVLLIATGKHLFYYQPLMPSYHFGVLVALPFATVAMLRALQTEEGTKPWRGASLALIVLTFITSLSDFLYIIQVVLPACFALLIWRKLLLISWWRFLKLSSILLLAAAAGHWLRQRIVPADKFLRYVNINEQTQISQSFEDFLEWCLDLANGDPLFTIFWLTSLLALLATLVIGILRLRAKYEGTAASLLVATIVLTSAFTSVAAMLASGNFEDSSSSRYILPMLFLPLFVGWPFLLATALSPSAPRNNMAADAGIGRLPGAVCALLALLLLVYIFLNTRLSSLAAVPGYQDPFVACLRQETAQRNLRYGLAEYWQADYASAILRSAPHIVSTSATLAPVLWNGNPHNYQHPFEFVISNPDAARPWQITEEFLRQKFGPPTDSFRCDTSSVFVYDRATNPQLRHWFAHHPELATFEHVGDVAEFYGYTLPSPIGGASVGLSMGASEQWDQDEGILAYAPLQALPAGSYALAFDLYADNSNAGLWEVIDITVDGPQLLFSETITPTGKSVITGHFDLKKESNVDVVVKYDGQGAFYLDRIRITRVDPTQAASFSFAEAAMPTDARPQATLSLIYPYRDSALARQETDFVWQWRGQPLPKEQTFEVRLWRKGDSIHYGAHDALVSRGLIRQIGDTYMLRLDITGAYSVMQHGAGDYEWTVAVVAVEPIYQELSIEAAPHSLSVLP